MAFSGQNLGSQKKECRITCNSNRCVDDIVATVTEQVEKHISESIYWTEEEQALCLRRFREIFEHTFHGNILVNSQPYRDTNDEGNVTLETEPYDLDKQRELNTVWLRDLDEAILDTALKRKHCPMMCAIHSAKQFKREKDYLSHIKVKVPSQELHIDYSEVPSERDTLDKYKTAMVQLSKIVKTLPDQMEQVTELRQAKRQLAGCQSLTDYVVYTPDVMSTKHLQTSTAEPTCRKLAFTEPPTEGKTSISLSVPETSKNVPPTAKTVPVIEKSVLETTRKMDLS